MAIKITAIRTNGPKPEHITHLKTEYNTTFTRAELYRSIESGKDYASGNHPCPRLECAISANGTKYVRSIADGTTNDNLMKLQRF